MFLSLVSAEKSREVIYPLLNNSEQKFQKNICFKIVRFLVHELEPKKMDICLKRVGKT